MGKVARWIKWGRDHWAWLLFLGIFILILAGACFWLISTARYNYNTRARVISAPAIAQGVEIRVEYPQKVLLNETRPLQIDFISTTPITQPVILTATFPPSGAIRPAGSTSDANGLQTRVTFEPGDNIERATIPIQNSGVGRGVNYELAAITIGTNLGHKFEPISIEVEGARHGARRMALSSVVERNTPLLIGLAALAASIPLIIQFWEKRREEQLRVEADLRARLGELQGEVRRCLREGSLRSAQAYFDELSWQQDRLRSLYLRDDTTHSQLDRLLQYAKGDIDQGELLSDVSNGQFLPEIAGALVCAAPIVKEKDEDARNNFQNIYLRFPADRIKDATQRQAFLRAQRQIFRYSLQKLALDSDAVPGEAKGEESIGPAERAEEEYWTLSGAEKRPNAFWPDHDAYRNPLNTRQHAILFGESGCGRSAFAWHALETLTDSKWFAVLIPGAISFVSIRERLADALLRYLSRKATRLLELPDESQRRLVAGILAEALGRDYVLAQLAKAQEMKYWVKDALLPEQKTIWPVVGDTELELLKRAVDEKPQDSSRRTPREWVREFYRSVRLMGFNGSRLILDADPYASDLPALSAADFRSWEEMEVFVTLCVRSDVYDSIQGKLHWIPAEELTWSPQQFDDLLKWRCKNLTSGDSGDQRTANFQVDFFEDDAAYEAFRAVWPATPRRLGQLWRALRAAHPSDRRYSVQQVRDAKEGLKE